MLSNDTIIGVRISVKSGDDVRTSEINELLQQQRHIYCKGLHSKQTQHCLRRVVHSDIFTGF